MPIFVKEFTWTETEKEVYIKIPLKGVNPKKVDIYYTDSFIKVNFVPFLFELDLFGYINYKASSVSIGDGHVSFSLQKVNLFKLN